MVCKLNKQIGVKNVIYCKQRYNCCLSPSNASIPYLNAAADVSFIIQSNTAHCKWSFQFFHWIDIEGVLAIREFSTIKVQKQTKPDRKEKIWKLVREGLKTQTHSYANFLHMAFGESFAHDLTTAETILRSWRTKLNSPKDMSLLVDTGS